MLAVAMTTVVAVLAMAMFSVAVFSVVMPSVAVASLASMHIVRQLVQVLVQMGVMGRVATVGAASADGVARAMSPANIVGERGAAVAGVAAATNSGRRQAVPRATAYRARGRRADPTRRPRPQGPLGGKGPLGERGSLAVGASDFRQATAAEC